MSIFQKFWRKILMYSRAPEMRLFWFSLPFMIAGSVGAVMLLPDYLRLAGIAFFLVLTLLVLLSGLRLALSNLQINVQHSQLDGIIKNLSVGVVFYDPDFKIRIFNRAAEKIFSLRSNDIVGSNITPKNAQDPGTRVLAQVIFPSLAPKIVRRSEANTNPQIFDLSFDDPSLELRVTTTPLVDELGRTVGFIKLVADRTRETELLRSKNSFITIAAHQLRTPLTGIAWALENLSKNESQSEEMKDFSIRGLKEARKLEQIIDDLLNVSKMEEGKFGYQFENTDIVSFIESILEETAQLAALHDVKVFFDKPPEQELLLNFDPSKLGMAFSNILDNAIKYNVKNGQVTVSIERLEDKPFVQISIKDTGVGVPPEQIRNLFKKFFRAENAIKYQTEGTGLGLYIVRNIIRRHGGDIWAESELNRGTTISFTLPTDPTLIPPEEVDIGNSL